LKILIVQLRRIGDVLLATPVLEYLKQTIPGVEIDFLVEPAAAPGLLNNPHSNEILIYDPHKSLSEIKRVRRHKYDAVVDFLSNPRSAYITGFSGAKWRVGFKKRLLFLFYNVAIPIPRAPEYVAKRKIRLIREWLKSIGREAPESGVYRPEMFLKSEETQYAENWSPQMPL